MRWAEVFWHPLAKSQNWIDFFGTSQAGEELPLGLATPEHNKLYDSRTLALTHLPTEGGSCNQKSQRSILKWEPWPAGGSRRNRSHGALFNSPALDEHDVHGRVIRRTPCRWPRCKCEHLLYTKQHRYEPEIVLKQVLQTDEMIGWKLRPNKDMFEGQGRWTMFECMCGLMLEPDRLVWVFQELQRSPTQYLGKLSSNHIFAPWPSNHLTKSSWS